MKNVVYFTSLNQIGWHSAKHGVCPHGILPGLFLVKNKLMAHSLVLGNITLI